MELMVLADFPPGQSASATQQGRFEDKAAGPVGRNQVLLKHLIMGRVCVCLPSTNQSWSAHDQGPVL